MITPLPEKPPRGREREHGRILEAGDFTGSIMPPPEAVAAGKVAAISDEDRRTLVRWIDLGCPIDFAFDPGDPTKRGDGWLFDDQRPTLALTEPQAGANPPLTRILVGMYDYNTGLDLGTFRVTADFLLDGAPAGEDLSPRFKKTSRAVWELKLAAPIRTLERGKLTVLVRDRQGNETRMERSFSVDPRADRSF